MSVETWACVIVPPNQNDFRPVVYGMGILVTDRIVVTCAHIVNTALGANWSSAVNNPVIDICFPYTEGPMCIKGLVDKENWYPPGPACTGKPTDIALIKLEEDAPNYVGGATLRNHVSDAEVKVYGFRGKKLRDGSWQSHPDGEIAVGRVTGSLPGGRAQFDGKDTTGAVIQKGFSGAGVYDPKQDAVVGMVVVADKNKKNKMAQFITAQYLEKALKKCDVPVLGIRKITISLSVAKDVVSRTTTKRQEIEGYLSTVAAALVLPTGDTKLRDYLEPILTKDTDDSILLRGAFDFPKTLDTAQTLYSVIGSSEPSMQSFISIIAQRIDHLLWRYVVTLKCINADWARTTQSTAETLRTLCEPHLLAFQPSLLDISAAIRLKKDMKAFTESAPDPTLYAVLRALDLSKKQPLAVSMEEENEARELALKFLVDYLEQLISGTRDIDDSSNAWWTLRTGIDSADKRYKGLLPKIANKYKDIRVPPPSISRISPVPEIHKPLRTASYTLSNIQHIIEVSPKLTTNLRKQLHEILTIMVDRLLRLPRSNQLYLASVHHEGLGNFLDYVKDQNLKVLN